MGNKERKARQREELRATVLLAAESIAESEGWEAVTMRRLADEVDYTPPTLYEIFKSKKGVLDELGLKGYHDMLQKFRGIDTTLPAKERLRCMSRLYWQFSQEHPALYLIMFGPDIPCPDFVNPPEDGGMFGILCRIVAEVRPADTEAAIQQIAIMIWSTIHGFVNLNIAQYSDPVQRSSFMEGLFDQLVETFTKK
jgi:AcrR family transcriptional regulator